MRPWRVGRAEKPHDYASWLRGSLKAHPCTCIELAESFRPPFGRFLRQLASPNREVGQRHAALRAALLLMTLTHPPVPVGKCWTEKPLAGRAMDCASSVAGTGCAFDRTRPVLAYPRGAAAWATGHRVASFGDFSLREKSYWVGGSRTIRLTHLVTAEQERSGGRQHGETLDQFGDSQQQGRSDRRE